MTPQVQLELPVKTAALPMVIMMRVTREVLRRRRHVGRFVRTAPLVALFSVIWSVGELVGYLAGPGDSLVRVR